VVRLVQEDLLLTHPTSRLRVGLGAYPFPPAVDPIDATVRSW
jgi:hypothetical protein